MIELTAASLAAFYLERVTALRPQVVFELGARYADFSQACRKALPDTEVHAFEANSATYDKSKRRLEGTGVNLHNVAIGDHVGPATFHIQLRVDGVEVPRRKGSNSLRRKFRTGVEYEGVPVQMITVDHFASEHGLIGKSCAFWIDLEGCAYEALEAAERTLESALAVMVEVEESPFWIGQRSAADVDRFMREHSFSPVARDHEYPTQYNVVYERNAAS